MVDWLAVGCGRGGEMSLLMVGGRIGLDWIGMRKRSITYKEDTTPESI